MNTHTTCRCVVQPHGGISTKHEVLSDSEILRKATQILESRFTRSNYLTSPGKARDYLRLAFACEAREVFGVVLLDNQHGVLGLRKLFYGTIDGAQFIPGRLSERRWRPTRRLWFWCITTPAVIQSPVPPIS